MYHRRFWRDLRYDCRNLWGRRKKRWMTGIGVQIFIYSMNLQDMYLTDKNISLYDIWFSTFSGIREYVKTENGEFELPVLWMVFQAYLLFILCDYIMDGLSDLGVQSFIRAASRIGWILRKNLICAVFIILFYLQYLLISWIGLLLAGSASACKLAGAYYQEMFQSMGWGKAFFLPIVMSVTLQLIQNAAGILFGSYTAYMISLGGLILAAYKMNPFFIGNYGMLLRSNMLSDNGVTIQGEITVCSIFLLTAVLTSVYFVKKFDIVGKGLEDKWK